MSSIPFFRVHTHKTEFRTPKTQYNGNTHLILCLNHEYLKTKLNNYLKITTEITCILDFLDGNFIKIIQELALESFLKNFDF